MTKRTIAGLAVAFGLVGFVPSVRAQSHGASATTAAAPLRAVFHLEDPTRETALRGLQNVLAALRTLGSEPSEFVIVVHGPAMRWFLRNEPDNVGTELAQALATHHVEWRACRITMEQHHWTAADLLPGVVVVPSGTVDVLRLEQRGYAYFRP